jgi:hypothetical protein
MKTKANVDIIGIESHKSFYITILSGCHPFISNGLRFLGIIIIWYSGFDPSASSEFEGQKKTIRRNKFSIFASSVFKRNIPAAF